MKSEKEIKKLLNQWEMLRADLIDCGDTVSLIVAEHSLFYINTLLWVLDDKQKVKGK